MITALFLDFPAYIIAQIAAIIYLRRGWRWTGFVPVLLMISVVTATIKFWIEQDNLWPLLLLFSSPVALLYALAIFGFNRLLKHQP